MTLTDRLTDRPTDRANIVQSALFEGWKIEGRDLQLLDVTFNPIIHTWVLLQMSLICCFHRSSHFKSKSKSRSHNPAKTNQPVKFWTLSQNYNWRSATRKLTANWHKMPPYNWLKKVTGLCGLKFRTIFNFIVTRWTICQKANPYF